MGHFLKKWTWETFLKFPIVCIFAFRKNMNPRLYILFLVDKSMM